MDLEILYSFCFIDNTRVQVYAVRKVQVIQKNAGSSEKHRKVLAVQKVYKRTEKYKQYRKAGYHSLLFFNLKVFLIWNFLWERENI